MLMVFIQIVTCGIKANQNRLSRCRLDAVEMQGGQEKDK